MFQQMQIIGRLGRDAEMRYSPNGDAVTSFSVAVDDGTKDNKKTIWFRCTLWRERAEKLTPYLTKGQVVFVEGQLRADAATGECPTWTDNSGKTHASFEINVREIKLLPGGPRRDEAQPEPEQSSSSGFQDVPF